MELKWQVNIYFFTEPGNSWLKTVETLSAITQFANLKPTIILESRLTREYLLPCLKKHLRCKAGPKITNIKKPCLGEISLSTQ